MRLLKVANRMCRFVRYGYRGSSELYNKYLIKHGACIGKNVMFFDPVRCCIDPARLDFISIGNNTKITSNFTMLAHDYSFSVIIETHKEILPPGGKYTSIGNNCFIGVNVTVMPGVSIGDNVIVGSNSVVTKNIPSNSVAAGNPAKVIMTLDEYYSKRKANYNEDLIRCIEHLQKIKGRNPDIDELGMYAAEFMEHNEENWNGYFSKIKYPGCDKTSVKEAYMNTCKHYENIKQALETKGEN